MQSEKKQKQKRRIPLILWMLIPMLVCVLIQCGVLVLFLTVGDTMDKLRSASINITVMIILIVVVFVVGIVFTAFMAYIISRPISSVSKKINSVTVSEKINIDHVGISEVDSLIESIEQMGERVMENSSRLSRIIGLSGLPVGAFELNKRTHKITFMGSFSEITGIKNLSDDMTLVEINGFFGEWDKKYVGMSDDGSGRVYSFENEDGEQRWVEYKTFEGKDELVGVVRDITGETVVKSRIEHERDYDLLTNLLNRRAFFAKAEELFQIGNDLKCAAVIMVDLDNLKSTNDTYGHETGDDYIGALARTLKSFTPHGQKIVSRMSGDEFIALLYGYDDKKQLMSDINALKDSIYSASIILPDRKKMRIMCSAGVAFYPEDSDKIDDLIRYADFAMYEVKHGEKGDFKEFSKEKYTDESPRSADTLADFITGNNADFLYQPIVDLRRAVVFGYEALMRDKSDKLSGPLEILSLAKSQSRLGDIEKIAFFKVLDGMSENRALLTGKKVFINSVAGQHLSAESVALAEKKYGKMLNRLVFELTEDEENADAFSTEKLEYIRDWGAEIALDDFCMNTRSEEFVDAVAPQYIKIDIYVVRGIDKDEAQCSALKKMVALAKEKNIKVIAEGVETYEEMRMLMKCGVDYAQGFYLGKPDSRPGEIGKILKAQIADIIKTAD